MPGLRLGVMGGVNATATAGQGSAVSTPTTATAAAFGPGYTQTGTPSASSALIPNDPFGIAFWFGVACVVGLLVVRHSLPR